MSGRVHQTKGIGMRGLANNFTRLREVNAELVRSHLKERDAVTKAELARFTGLSVATCGNILADMLVAGEAQELELASPDGGRPPRLYAYAPEFSLTALIFPKSEAGGKYITYAVVDAKGRFVEKAHIDVAVAGLDAIDDLVDGLVAKYPNLKALALSIPGQIAGGRVDFCDLPELEGVDMAGHLHERYGLPVATDNDMNLAALGFYHERLSPTGGSVVYIVSPSKNCTGAGIVIDGKVVAGATAFAGELSFMPFGVSRERQFAGLDNREAFKYTAKLAVSMIAVLNPTVLVVASELVDEEALLRLQRFCLAHIPGKHLPELVARARIDDDCLAGLAVVAASALAGKMRLIEER